MPRNLIRTAFKIGMFAKTSIVYTFRDDFTTADDAPLTSPRTCEPGPGTLTIADTGNRFSISAGKLLMGTGTTNCSAFSDAMVRAAGLAMFGVITVPTDQPVQFGWTDDAGANTKEAFYIAPLAANTGVWAGGGLLPINLFTPSQITKYCVILRAAGAFFVGLIGGVWKVIWIDNILANTSPKIRFNNANNSTTTCSLDNWRVTQLSGNWLTAYGIATSSNLTPATGNTLVGTADGLFEFTYTAAAGETVDFMFRRTDDNNCWIVRIVKNDSKFYLYQKELSSETERGATGGTACTFTTGTKYRILVIAEGQSIKVVIHTAATAAMNTDTIAYASASFNLTATGLKVSGFAAGENLVSWPRTVALPSPFLSERMIFVMTYGDSKTAADWHVNLTTSLNASAGGHTWAESKRVGRATHSVAMMIEHLADDVTNLSDAVTPDFILCDLGVNDVISEWPLTEATWKANYLTIVDAMNARFPNAKIYIAQPWSSLGEMANWNTLATWISDIVAQRSFLRLGHNERVWLEGGNNGATMTSDGTHYSDPAGWNEVAAQWTTLIGAG